MKPMGQQWKSQKEQYRDEQCSTGRVEKKNWEIIVYCENPLLFDRNIENQNHCWYFCIQLYRIY